MAIRKMTRKSADKSHVRRDSAGKFAGTTSSRSNSRPMKKAGSRRVSEDIDEEELSEE